MWSCLMQSGRLVRQDRFNWRMWPGYLNSPRSKIKFQHYISLTMDALFPQESPIQRVPQESGIHFPGRKLIPCKVRTSLLSLYSELFPLKDLQLGYPQLKNHRRSPPAKFLRSPAEFIIKVLNRPLVKSRPNISSTEQLPGRSSRIYFPKTKITFINISHFQYILFTYVIKCILTLSHVKHHDAMHSIHHDIAYNLCFCLYREKDNPKDDYPQLSQFQIRYLYLARAPRRVIISRLDSCI